MSTCTHPPGHGQWFRLPFRSGGGYHLLEWCRLCNSNARGAGRWAPRHACPHDPDGLPSSASGSRRRPASARGVPEVLPGRGT